MAAPCWLPAGSAGVKSFPFLTNASSSSKRRSFPKNERLSRQKAITELFRGGTAATEQPLRLTWLPADHPPTQVMFAVPKSVFKNAVDRNLLKRRMREAYRSLKSHQIGAPFRLGFVYVGKRKEEFGQILAAMAKLLGKVGVKGGG